MGPEAEITSAQLDTDDLIETALTKINIEVNNTEGVETVLEEVLDVMISDESKIDQAIETIRQGFANSERYQLLDVKKIES